MEADRKGGRTAPRSVGTLAALAICALLALPSAAQALQQKLVASDGAQLGGGGQGGPTVAIDGDTAVAGAPGAAGGGAVYVFTRSGDTWAQTGRLTASDRASGDAFGTSVAIDGDTIVVGAPRDNPAEEEGYDGAVYTFARTGAANRTETAKLTTVNQGPDPEDGYSLGLSVAIDGDTIVAGGGGPFAFTFASTGANRNETASLYASDIDPEDDFDHPGLFGDSIAIDGDTIVVGAPRKKVFDSPNGQGAIYTFTRTGPVGEARTETARMHATDGADADWLGESVAIGGDTIAVGAPGAGKVYTFARTGDAARTQTAILTSSRGTMAAQDLGASIDIDGDTILAGAPFETHPGSQATWFEGAAYTFARTGAAARTETERLVAPDAAYREFFGAAVAIEGDTILMGVPSDEIGATRVGTVHVLTPGPGGNEMNIELKGPKKVDKNDKAKLKVTLGPCPAVDGVAVTFEKKVGDDFEPIGTDPASGDSCKAGLAPKVKKTTTFRATTPDAGGYLGATSTTIKVKVKKR